MLSDLYFQKGRQTTLKRQENRVDLEKLKTTGLAVALAIVGAIVVLAQGGNLPLPSTLDPKVAAALVAIIIAVGTALIDSLKQQAPPHG